MHHPRHCRGALLVSRAPATDNPPVRLVRGDVVGGQYEVERHLESDGSVETYLARHLLAGRKIRLKVVRLDEPWIISLAGRSEAWATVQDESLVPCISAGPVGKKGHYFAFASEKGPTLEGIEGTLSPESVIEMGAQLASALSTLHEEDLVHGHLRPSEVILSQTRNGAPRLLDPVQPPTSRLFGRAPTYLAPEVIAGAPLTPASDVYALGIMLAELWNGASWVVTEGQAGKMLGTLFGLRPALSPEDPSLASWLRRMTAMDPAERPEARQVHAAFRQVHAGGVLPALPAPTPAVEGGTKALAVVLLRPPGSKTAEAAGLDVDWRHAVKAHGTNVCTLVDGTLLCRVDRGTPSAVVTTVGLVVRTSQEHAFRASVACGLLMARDEDEREHALLDEIMSLDRVASRTPAGVVRFTARLAARIGSALPIQPSGDSFVLSQAAEPKRARRGGTLEMEISPRGNGGRRRKSSEITVDPPQRRGRGGTLVMEPGPEVQTRPAKRGGTLELGLEGGREPLAGASGDSPVEVEPPPSTMSRPTVPDPIPETDPPNRSPEEPTVEVVVDPLLVEATRKHPVAKKTARRSTWGRRSS